MHVDDLLFTGLREKTMTWNKPIISVEHWNGMRNGLGARPDRRHVRSLLREMGMENCRSVSTPLSATAEREGDRSDCPEVSAELATKHQAAVASNASHGICMVTLTTFNGPQFRKKRKQLF